MPPASQPIGQRIATFVVSIVFFVGLFAIGRWSWDRFVGLHLKFSASAAVAGGWSWLSWFLHDQAAIWITGIATAFLWRATAMLTRATNIEHARTGPFLTVFLVLDDPSVAQINPRDVAYPDTWASLDASEPALQTRQQGAQSQYVSLTITNQQSTPHGVASDVLMLARLSFGAADDVAPHPYHFDRPIGPFTILADKYIEGPLFNVGGLTNWVVTLQKVEYRDIMKRDRTAAVGTGGLHCSVSGNVTPIIRVFEPRKGEYTDAD